MSARLLSYEVYYLQNGRWQIHARYKGSQKEEAFEEAKQLDSTGHVEATCVVRESFDSSANESDESVVYHSPSLSSKPPVSNITASAGAGGASADPPPDGSAAANALVDAEKRELVFQQQQQTEIDEKNRLEAERVTQHRNRADNSIDDNPGTVKAVMTLTIVAMVCLIPASIISYIAFYVLNQAAQIGLEIKPDVGQVILLLSFILSYGAFFLPMLKKFVDISALTGSGGRRKAVPTRATAVPTRATAVPRPGRRQAGVDSAGALAEGESAGAEENVFEEEVKDALSEEEAKVADTLDVTPPEIEGDGDTETLDHELERLYLETRTIYGDKVDDYTRFGLTLFFTGSGEAYGKRGRVPKATVMNRLVDWVAKLGTTPRLAKGFVSNIAEYLVDERYFSMYKQGRNSAYRRIIDTSAESGLRTAVDDWRNPPPAEEQSEKSKENDEKDKNFVAILFTDIVNSTAQQQANGDEWMMDVIRAHNEIVRGAIRKFEGREIKHTGDGIMATFPAVSNSVDAAITMQVGFNNFERAMPESAFLVRVGISAGEPIHESGDIFGTPVNLAARVLSKAGDSEIAVSSIVKELSRGRNRVFESKGDFELKGFSEPERIYAVNYSSLLQTKAAS